MKSTTAQQKFLARFEGKDVIHVRNGEKATAQALIDRGTIVEDHVDEYGMRWVRIA